MGITNDRVKFNVGGRVFEKTATTLADAWKNSMQGAILDENWNLLQDNGSEKFIDHNSYCFYVLLDLIQTREPYIP